VDAVSQFLVTCGLQTPATAQAVIGHTGLALVQGQVLDSANHPLGGVVVNVLGDTGGLIHGQTTSRNDGHFSLRVMGGRVLSLNFARGGYISVQRQVTADVDGFVTAPSVVLRALSTSATTVNLGSGSPTWATGDLSSDTSGNRTAKLFFPSGLAATNGTTGASLSSISVTATEFTVGANGLASMPGSLPPTSAYTYAVELNAAQSNSVKFSKPVPVYVDGFLSQIPLGTPIPAGYYDRTAGQWVAAGHGRVLKIVGNAGGSAQISFADGVTESQDDKTLATNEGITSEERLALATAYSVGKVLWRVPVTHFSAWDFNFPFGPCSTCKAPPKINTNKTANANNRLNDGSGCKLAGSIIGCEEQTLGQELPVLGTGFGLHYISDRVPGRAAEQTVNIRLSDGSLGTTPNTTAPTSVHLEVDIAGQHSSQTFPYTTLSTTFTWNGLDGFGRPVQGAQLAKIRVGYEYPGTYYVSKGAFSQAFDQAFGQVGGATGDTQLSAVAARDATTITLWREWTAPLGNIDARALGLGGWTLTNHHVLDPVTGILYRGDGTTLRPSVLGATLKQLTAYHITTTGPTGSRDGFIANGNGVGALQDGTVVVPVAGGNSSYNWLARVGADGVATPIAGKAPVGDCHSNGSTGDALDASFCGLDVVTASPDGQTLFVAERTLTNSGHDWRVRRLRAKASGWSIETIAGACTVSDPCASTGDGQDAKNAKFVDIRALAPTTDGSLYLLDGALIRRIGPDGIITTVAGSGTGGVPKPGQLARQASLSTNNKGLGADSAGRIFFAGPAYMAAGNSDAVYVIDNSGQVSILAGGGAKDSSSDGGPATDALMPFIGSIAVDPQGRVLIAHANTGVESRTQLRLVEPDGTINTIVKGGGNSSSGLAYPISIGSALTRVAFGPRGTMLLIDSATTSVQQISPVAPSLVSGEFVVADQGGGALHIFKFGGRHDRTVASLTGGVLWKFSYDQNHLVSQVDDLDGRATLLDRSVASTVTLTSPDGLPTKISLSTNKWATAIGYPSATTPSGQTPPYEAAYPSGVQYQMAYDANTPGDGLLASFTDPRGKVHSFTYDAAGRVHTDVQPATARGSTTLDLVSSDDLSWQVDVTSSEGRKVSHSTAYDNSGVLTRSLTSWDGRVSSSSESRDGKITSSSSFAGGSRLSSTTLTKGPDGVLGMAAPIIQSGTIQLGKTDVAAGLYGPTMNFSVDDTGSSLGAGGLLGGMTRTRAVTINNNKWVTSFDPATSRMTVTGPALKNGIGPLSASMILDAKGRPTTAQTPWAADVSVLRDGVTGRLSTISQSGRQVRAGWDSHGFLTSYTPNSLDAAASQHTTTLNHDGIGRVRQVTPPGLQPVKMTPDPSGNLVSLTLPASAGQEVHGFGYDDVDRLKTHTPPLVGTSADTSLYTADGLPGTATLLSGRTITPTYGDSKKRLTQLDFALSGMATASLKLAYDDLATGQLKSLTLGSEVLSFGYNGALLTDVSTAGTTSSALHFVFNDDFRVASYTLGGINPVSFVYDNDGLPLSASTGGATLTRTRATNGLVNAVTIGTLTEVPSVDLTYGEISGSSSAFGAATLYRYSIEKRDSQGRELIRIESIPAVGSLPAASSRVRYGYDAAGRLTQRFTCSQSAATDPGCTSSATLAGSWSFDDNGNRLTAGTASFTYDLQDRLVSQTISGSRPVSYSYTHDADGHLTSVARGALTDTTYSYDVLGRLTQVQLASPAHTVSFVLDPLGRRVQRTLDGAVTNRWVYLDALRPAAEYDGSGALVSRFVYLSGRNVPDLVLKGTTAFRLLTDERGSVRLVVNATTGAVAQRLDYDEWGVVTADTSPGLQPFGFAGGMQDPTTHLVHFGARDFAPQLGRWITKDPSGMAGGVNLFGYAAGDPVDFIDADGQNPAAVAVAVGVVLLGGAMVQSSDDYPGVAAYGAVVGNGAALATSGAGAALGKAAGSAWGQATAWVGALCEDKLGGLPRVVRSDTRGTPEAEEIGRIIGQTVAKMTGGRMNFIAREINARGLSQDDALFAARGALRGMDNDTNVVFSGNDVFLTQVGTGQNQLVLMIDAGGNMIVTTADVIRDGFKLVVVR
jgi:RHS repeat-associated protein